jgi:EmrB/QacA subfamily drug resistance transporter
LPVENGLIRYVTGLSSLAAARKRAETFNQKIAVSVVFVAAMFMNIIDITIVNVALPSIGRDFGATVASVGAVSVAYLVALAVVIPASGWLGDRFGYRRVLLTAIVIFTVASALCGVAQNLPELVGFRVLQGIGGGMLTPVGMALLYRTFPPEERVRASSILTIPTTLAPAIGPVIGGVLVTGLSWQWVFLVNLPIGAAALLFGLIFLHEQATDEPGRFDRVGFVLSGIGFAALMYGVSEGGGSGWGKPRILVALIVGVVLIAALVPQQLRNPQPLLNFRLYRNRNFRSTSAVMFTATGAFLGMLYVIALFFQDGLGLSALQSGLSTFPEAFGVMLGAQIVSRFLYPAFGPRRVIAGGLFALAGAMLLLTQISGRDQLWEMRGLMFVLGICMAHAMVPSQAASMAQIDRASTGRASTLFNATRQIGSAAGIAVLATVITAVGFAGGGSASSGGAPDLRPYHVAFVVSAGLAFLGALFALMISDADAAATRVARRGRKQAAAEQAQPVPAA